MRSQKSIIPILALIGLAGCTLSTESGIRSSASTWAAREAALSASRAGVAREALVAAPALERAPVVLARDEAALAVLQRRVTRQSHPEALRLAFQAYWNFREANPHLVRNPYFYFVDYGLDSREPRGYVFDMDALDLVEGPFTVAHGRGSASGREGVPTRFTNVQNSATTSLGLYLAEETYAFSGTSSGRRYRSIGLRLRGVSGTFNNAARRRGIVVHGAPYVTPVKAGRSEGCPAMEPDRAERLIPMIADGGVVFHFSARDAKWMREDPWMNRPSSRFASRAAERPDG